VPCPCRARRRCRGSRLQGAHDVRGELNAKGGLLGRKVELIIATPRRTPTRRWGRPRDDPEGHVDFLMGTLTSAEGPAVSCGEGEQDRLHRPIPKTDQLTGPTKLHPTCSASRPHHQWRAARGRDRGQVPVTKVATIAFRLRLRQDVTKAFVEHNQERSSRA